MNRPTLIAAAATLDALLGDPESLPHPVRLFGHIIAWADAHLHRDEAPTWNLAAGATLSLGLVAATYLITQRLIRLHPAVEILLASTTLASRNLQDEAHSVLDGPTLPQARTRLARIVGRDTATLAEPQIARALIETLAESSCDGIVAPLFFLALGGVPLAMAFKAASTLDSMIAHRTPRHLHFGRVAARLDDAANYLPARLTAAAILALHPTNDTLRTWKADHSKHASPNAGHPESAIAGALQVQLGGPSTYGGELHHAPILGALYPLPTRADAQRALRLTRQVSLLATVAAIVLATLIHHRHNKQPSF